MACVQSIYNIPTLHQRKNIWENFPVTLVPLGRGQDGAERHAVVWHRKNLVEKRNNNVSDSKCWILYEKMEESRLLLALSKSPYWTVEQPQELSQICIIRMKFKSSANNSMTQHNYNTRNVATLTCLNDIKEFFPVVIWHETESDMNKKSYSIELSNKKLKEMKCKNAQNEMIQNLLQSLKASTAWVTLPAEGPTEFCRIQMK